MDTEKKVIGALGAGRMGRGIALAFAYSGYPVELIDMKPRDDAAFQALTATVTGELGRDIDFLASAGALDRGAASAVTARVRLVRATDTASAVADADILFECVPETIEAKRECYRLINLHARADALVASTTSTIGANVLAGLIDYAARFCNAHWLNPAHLMPLVELSPCDTTSPQTIEAMRTLLTGIGKVPIVCKSSPGYIVPRIQALAMNEAARLVDEGVASAEDIDTAIKVGFGLRFAVLGLLEFTDWGGGDILYYASRFLAQAIGPERFTPPAIIETHMLEHRRGLSDGAGFYEYGQTDLGAYRNEKLSALVELLKLKGLMPRPAGH